MGDKTGINWTDASWNHLRGCSREMAEGATTSGCGDPTGGGCYAERNGYRFAGPGLPYEGLVRMTPNGPRWTGKVMVVDKHLLDPVRWERPRRIFTTSVSDPFHPKFSNETIAITMGVMAITRRHTHQMLTKRAARMLEWYRWVKREAETCNGGRGMSVPAYCFCMLQQYVRSKPDVFSEHEYSLITRGEVVDAGLTAPWPLPNVIPMVSVEHQAAANHRIPHLLQVPAVCHGVSLEPLIGPVDLTMINDGSWYDREGAQLYDATTGHAYYRDGEHGLGGGPRLGWAIIGCESGPGARQADPNWIRSLIEQCSHAMVPVLVKQAIETDVDRVDDEYGSCSSVSCGVGSKRKGHHLIDLPYIDGVQYAQFPEMPT